MTLQFILETTLALNFALPLLYTTFHDGKHNIYHQLLLLL